MSEPEQVTRFRELHKKIMEVFNSFEIFIDSLEPSDDFREVSKKVVDNINDLTGLISELFELKSLLIVDKKWSDDLKFLIVALNNRKVFRIVRCFRKGMIDKEWLFKLGPNKEIQLV